MPRGRPKKIINKEEPKKEEPKKEESGCSEVKDKDAINKLMNEINREYGETVLMYGSSIQPKEKIPFSIESINKLTHGGICLGLFSIIWGDKSVGKTTLVYDLIAQAQKQGKRCMLLDFERGFDAIWASKIGVQPDKLMIGKFDTAEKGLEVLKTYAKAKLVDFVVIDSIQGLSPKSEQVTKTGQERSLDEDTMALLARKLSEFFRKVADSVDRGKVAILLVGQARLGLGKFVVLEELSGGHALKHWASIIIRIRRGQGVDAPFVKFIKEGKKMKRKIGFDCVLKIEKTKIDSEPELSELHLPFYFETGFSKPNNVEVKTEKESEEVEENDEN